MRIWIDIEDSAGNKLGDGPITSATGWESEPRLDEAGTFSFEMPASDPRAVLLENKRIVRCWGMVDGEARELGTGIIDQVEAVVADPTMLRVSGPDLLAELGNRTVGNLATLELGWTYLNEGRGKVGRMNPIDQYGPGYWYSDYPNAYDGNTGTYETTFLRSRWLDPDLPESAHWLYVGYDARFDRVRFTLSEFNTNDDTVMIVQYYSKSGWQSLAHTDGTKIGSRTWAQSGDVTFTRPSDWVRHTAIGGAGNWFWVRFTIDVEWPAGIMTTTDVRLHEVRVYADLPTTDALNQIMAYAPDAWQRSGYPATGQEVYHQFAGESVLAALRTVAQTTGEHFRLGPGRSITWLSAFGDSGLRAVQAGDPVAQEQVEGIALVTGLRERRDTSEAFSRLYPSGSDGITLAQTTRSAPAGYTLSKTDNYIRRDATEASMGRIDRVAQYPDIGVQQRESLYEHPRMAANMLFDRALEELKRHSAEERFYDLEIGQVRGAVLPGQTIHVVYDQFVDGYHAIAIDADLHILSTRVRVDQGGLHTMGLEVATVDRPPQDDAGVLVGTIQDVRRGLVTTAQQTVETVVQQIVSSDVRITGGNIDGTPIGESVPSSGRFTVLAVDSDIDVGGTVDGVDVGNPGDGLQIVSERLAVDASVVRTSRQVATSAGLSGGGNLASDRTLSVDQSHAFEWTGVHQFKQTTHARTILPEATDTYDLGSSTKLWRQSFISQMNAVLFAENTAQLLGGWFVVPKDQGSFVARVAPADTEIDLGRNLTGDLPQFILIRAHDEAGEIQAEYMRVDSLESGTVYHVTRDLAGIHDPDPAWAEGTPFMVLGSEGDGRIELNAQDTPRIQIIEQGEDYDDQEDRVRIGDLNGSFGVDEERYGFGVGDYEGGNYLRYDGEDGFLFHAGGGVVSIDDDGITIIADTKQYPYEHQRSLAFLDPNTGHRMGALRGFLTEDEAALQLAADHHDKDRALYLTAGPDGQLAKVALSAQTINDPFNALASVTLSTNLTGESEIKLKTAEGMFDTGRVVIESSRLQVHGGLYVGGTDVDPDDGEIRAAGNVSADGFFMAKLGATLVINNDTITVTSSFHQVDTEGGAATDDLYTINGGANGALLILKSVNNARVVTLRDGGGNLVLAGHCTLATVQDMILLAFYGGFWREISRSING